MCVCAVSFYVCVCVCVCRFCVCGLRFYVCIWCVVWSVFYVYIPHRTNTEYVLDTHMKRHRTHTYTLERQDPHTRYTPDKHIHKTDHKHTVCPVCILCVGPVCPACMCVCGVFSCVCPTHILCLSCVYLSVVSISLTQYNAK